MPGRFVVDLSDLGIDDDRLAMIEKSINTAVLDVLAEVKPREDVSIRFPWEWRGLVAALDREKLGELDKAIMQGIPGQR